MCLLTCALALKVGTKDKMNYMTIGWGELAKKKYSDRPLHSVYIGEIVNALIKE